MSEGLYLPPPYTARQAPSLPAVQLLFHLTNAAGSAPQAGRRYRTTLAPGAWPDPAATRRALDELLDTQFLIRMADGPDRSDAFLSGADGDNIISANGEVRWCFSPVLAALVGIPDYWAPPASGPSTSFLTTAFGLYSSSSAIAVTEPTLLAKTIASPNARPIMALFIVSLPYR